jgi:hypothetical protein
MPADADRALVGRDASDPQPPTSGGWFVLVRHADDRRAATRALRRFRTDLFKSQLFAPLDGQFGHNADGSDIRYTPPYASVVAMTTDGPILAVDTESVLEAFPEVIAPMIARLRARLREAGIRRAEIGWPAKEPPLRPSP